MELDRVEFKEEKRFLSNMFKCEIKFEYMDEIKDIFDDRYFDNNIYGSSEHIYMSMKSENTNWHSIMRYIGNPTKTKKLAKELIIPFGSEIEEGKFFLREDFVDLKFDIMSRIVYLKFIQNPDLAEKLLVLDGHIEERNAWDDVYLGTCDGVGENNLGLILMEVREWLKTR